MARVQRTTPGKTELPFAPLYSSQENRVNGPTLEQISKRAYELFLARGGEHGHDVEDWLQAERELNLGRYQ